MIAFCRKRELSARPGASGAAESGKSTVWSGKIVTVCRCRPSPKRVVSTSYLSFQVPMPHHDLVLRREALAELLGDVDRPVAAAGTADRDRDRGALVEHEARQPALQETLDVLDEDFGLRLALEELDHFRVVAGERAQVRIVGRVGNAAARGEG